MQRSLITPDLRHHVVDPSSVFDRADITRWIKTTFRWLLDECAGKSPDRILLDQVFEEFQAADIKPDSFGSAP